MLTHNALFEQLRPLVHPMLVHFPIALLFASVALDWLGYNTWWRAVRQEPANANAPLWTLHRGHPATNSARPRPAQP